MSTIYSASDQETLAGKLATELNARQDFFAPATILVPNPLVEKWLKLWIAEHRGVAVNYRFLRLDYGLLELLRPMDNCSRDKQPELLDDASLRLLTLCALWDDDGDPDLAPLRDYITHSATQRDRSFCRRAWQLAERLAITLKYYEMYRGDQIIESWQSDRHVFPQSDLGVRNLEQSQKSIWRRVNRAIDDLREGSRRWTTLPRYADQLLRASTKKIEHHSAPIHLFGFNHFTPRHLDILARLAVAYDLRIYLADPFAGQAAPHSLLQHLGKPLAVTRQFLLNNTSFQIEEAATDPKTPSSDSVLTRLQKTLAGNPKKTTRKLRQDKSIQIVSSPSIRREMETVHNTIVHLLQTDKTLTQNDIVVLATDMDRYRPVLQAVFDEQQVLRYSLSDFTAANVSTFGQALLDMLDLALESFTRSRVFSVFLNPCFLAGIGVDRIQAAAWLEWVQRLGIYHGWNRSNRKKEGYRDSSSFSWQWGLRRLRLGRHFAPESANEIRFANLLPYVDVSTDREDIDAFCNAIEGLLPKLTEWRGRKATANKWADDIRQVIEHFLDIPPDRPEESQVRDHILQSLDQLHVLGDRQIPLALVREILDSNLRSLSGNAGEPLIAGVTIAALQPMRALPFRIVFIIGLSEELFPGPNQLPAFDLRSRQLIETDLGPAEMKRAAFLDAVLSAREKLICTYTGRDLQKDQSLQPSGPLLEMKRLIEDEIIKIPFEIVETPISGEDSVYINKKQRLPYTDALVNFRVSERRTAIERAVNNRAATLSNRQKKELDASHSRQDFSVAANSEKPDGSPKMVTLRELARFLRCPATAAWRRHLRMRHRDDSEWDDDEPFRTAFPNDFEIIRESFDRFVRRSVETSLDEAIGTWPGELESLYDTWQDSGLAPEGAFAEVDRDVFADQLRTLFDSRGDLSAFLAARPSDEYSGPIAIGPSLEPISAQLHFPALSLAECGADVVGQQFHLWQRDDALDVLIQAQKKKEDLGKIPVSHHALEPILFYLALCCGNPEWIGKRVLRLHLSCRDGVHVLEYQSLSASDARSYLVDLVSDFLDPSQFDLLPFDIIMKHEPLHNVLSAESDAVESEYCESLKDACSKDSENLRPVYRRPSFFDIAAPDVPNDALHKVRRRYRLLIPNTSNNQS